MISNVYAYYLNNYANKSVTRHDTHKKSELRAIYNNIVKINKAAPFYKIDMSENSQKLAIDIKEAARDLSSVLNDITDESEGTAPISLEAESDNPSVLTAKYIGNSTQQDDDTLNFNVKQIALPQINTGNYLSTGARNLFAGKYSFDITVQDNSYELQFTIEDKDNNGTVQNKLARLFNNSNIGIKAEVVKNQYGQQALQLSSAATGSGKSSPYLFRINENTSSFLFGAVNTLGLDNVSQYPANAVFDLNGTTEISSSNIFNVDKKFEITLHGTSEEFGEANVILKQNGAAIAEDFVNLADKFNSLVDLTKKSDSYDMRRLRTSLTSLARKYKSTLDTNGIALNEDNSLTAKTEQLDASVNNGTIFNSLQNIDKFKNDLQSHIRNIEFNPMEYINKKVVAYKNPMKLMNTPYFSSVYSGMMFDGQI